MEFTRIKVGVGAKPQGWDLADFVLGHFDDVDKKIMEDAYKSAADACVDIMNQGVDFAMNRYNAKK